MARFAVDEKVLDAKNYRQFLIAVLKSGHDSIPRGQLSALARKSGLPRSFLTELLQNKKTLTGRSFPKLLSALKLPSDLKQYFTLLVAIEVDEIRGLQSGTTRTDMKLRLKQMQQRLVQKKQSSSSFSAAREKRVLSLEVFCVYAALGSLEKGAHIREIVEKTKLNEKIVERSLSTMTQVGWVAKKGEFYFATERALDFDGISQDFGFLQAFTESCAQLSAKAQKPVIDSDQLFFFSTFPINSKRVLEFRERARSALLDVVDEFQDDEGMLIRKVTLGVY